MYPFVAIAFVAGGVGWEALGAVVFAKTLGTLGMAMRMKSMAALGKITIAEDVIDRRELAD